MQNEGPRSLERTIAQHRDLSLIKTTLAGDQKSFARLMSLYENRIRALGMSFFKNTADTEDFVQDVFLKVYTNLANFRGDSMFSTWITSIAYNTAVNAKNRRKEYAPLSDEVQISDPDYTPEEMEIRRYTREAIQEAVKDLPERYAQCLDLFFFHDIPYVTISEMIDLPVNTIKSHIFRAKKILREKLIDLQ